MAVFSWQALGKWKNTDTNGTRINALETPHLPHEVVNRAVAIDAQCKMHRHDGLLEVAVHDKIRVGQPDILMVVNGVQILVLRVIVVAQTWIVPLLLQQKLHLVFLRGKCSSEYILYILYCTWDDYKKMNMLHCSFKWIVACKCYCITRQSIFVWLKFTSELTKLDSSGDAKLNSNTLTFTVNVPGIWKWIKGISYLKSIYVQYNMNKLIY